MSVRKKQQLTCSYCLYSSPHYHYNFRDRQSYDCRSQGCLHTRETSDGAFDLKEGVKSVLRVWEELGQSKIKWEYRELDFWKNGPVWASHWLMDVYVSVSKDTIFTNPRFSFAAPEALKSMD